MYYTNKDHLNEMSEAEKVGWISEGLFIETEDDSFIDYREFVRRYDKEFYNKYRLLIEG